MRICKHFDIIRTIYSKLERSEQVLAPECFFNFISNKLEFKLEKKILGFRNMEGKLDRIGLKFIGQNHEEPAIVGVPGVCKLFIVNWSKQIIKVDLWLNNDR